MLPILPGKAALPQQTNIGLVHKFGRLQAVFAGFATVQATRHGAQPGVNDRHEPVESLPVARFPLKQERCDFSIYLQSTSLLFLGSARFGLTQQGPAQYLIPREPESS